MTPSRQRPRPAAALVEAAIVLPLAFSFILAIMVGAHGVFTYHELASLTREGARYASVRSTSYQNATGQTPPNADQIYDAAIRPRMVTVNPARVTAYSVTWDRENSPGNQVTVRMQYNWMPVSVFRVTGMTSTSTMTITW